MDLLEESREDEVWQAVELMSSHTEGELVSHASIRILVEERGVQQIVDALEKAEEEGQIDVPFDLRIILKSGIGGRDDA